MHKKQFIALADAIRHHDHITPEQDHWTPAQLETLADFCASENHKFLPNRWLAYIRGECGPNGGALK